MSYCSQCAIRDKEVEMLKDRLRVMELEAVARQKLPGTDVIFVQSLVSHRDQKPRVDIQLGEIHSQMSADAAMDVAKNIIEACEAAHSDAFIFNFMKEKVGLDDGRAARVIVDFRNYRQELAEEFEKDQKDPI